MINMQKLAALITSIGFSRAVFVCAICLLTVRIVNFEQFVILVLFGFTFDPVRVRGVSTHKLSPKRHGGWRRTQLVQPVPHGRSKGSNLTDLSE